jgi:hypothetical protein
MRANVDSGKDPVFSAGSTDRLKIRAFASRTQTIAETIFTVTFRHYSMVSKIIGDTAILKQLLESWEPQVTNPT